MKIVFATHFPHDPGKPHGGVEAVVVNLAQGITRLGGIDLSIVTLDSAVEDSVIDDWDGIKIHRLPRRANGELLNAITTGRREIQAYIRSLSPDIVHAHDTYGIMMKGLELPRVFTVHGFIYADTRLSNKKLSFLRSMMWKYIEQSSWSEQPNIISISPYVRERVSGLSKAVIFDIDNPISSDFFEIQRNEGKGIVFSAAHINPRKNTLSLIEAACLLKKRGVDIELRLAGKITDAQYGNLIEEAINRCGLRECVKMLGVVGSDRIRDELSTASIFALVSHEENSPMGIEEAMAAGVPIVTSNKCGMPYMVNHRASGLLVDQMKPEDIANKIAFLLTNDAERKRMGEHAKRVAQERFHIDVVAKRTFDTYQEILDAYPH